MIPQFGDLILYNVNGRSEFISRLVGAGQLILGIGHSREVYSHVAVMSDRKGYQFEAKVPRAGEFPIDDSREYEVWRIGDPTDAQRDDILRWCRKHAGDWYNLTGLLTDGLVALRRTYVCSQFGGRAYKAAGIRISSEGNRVLAPDAIPDAPGARCIARYAPPKGRA